MASGKTVPDREFDRVFPEKIRMLSSLHWTPLDVVQKAVRFLVRNEHSRILDIGSGVGKFCIAGGILSRGVFTGMEKRPELVKTARDAACQFQLHTVNFIEANVIDIDWDEFDGFYFYNPFYEQLVEPRLHIDNSIVTSKEKFQHYISVSQQKLRRLKDGTRVVTYSGLGGPMPTEYDKILSEQINGCDLSFWVKTTDSRDNLSKQHLDASTQPRK